MHGNIFFLFRMEKEKFMQTYLLPFNSVLHQTSSILISFSARRHCVGGQCVVLQLDAINHKLPHLAPEALNTKIMVQNINEKGNRESFLFRSLWYHVAARNLRISSCSRQFRLTIVRCNHDRMSRNKKSMKFIYAMKSFEPLSRIPAFRKFCIINNRSTLILISFLFIIIARCYTSCKCIKHTRNLLLPAECWKQLKNVQTMEKRIKAKSIKIY